VTAVIMRRTIHGLVPSDLHQYDELIGNRIKLGDEVKCVITKPRNLKFHRKFFAMVNETFAMQNEFETIRQWRAVVITGAGHCDFIKGKDGQMIALPKSIAFHNMDETKFNRLFEDVLTFICARYVDDSPERLNTILEFS